MKKEKLNNIAMEAKRKYAREWRKNNPEKVRKYAEEYWLKKAKQTLEEKDHEQPENQDN